MRVMGHWRSDDELVFVYSTYYAHMNGEGAADRPHDSFALVCCEKVV